MRSAPVPTSVDLDVELALDELDVAPGSVRQVVDGRAVVERLLPAGQRLVDRPRAWKSLWCAGKSSRLLAVAEPVARAHGQLGEVREHVELRQREPVDPVHAHGVAERDEVEPAAAPVASGDDAVLVAELADRVLVGPLDLGRERPVADAGDVRLRDADHAVDPVRADADAGCSVRRRPCSTR